MHRHYVTILKKMSDNQSNIYLSKANLAHNLAYLRSKVAASDTLCVCVKANAYGHGLQLIATELMALNVDWLAIHTLNEGATLRNAGFTNNILVLGPLVEPKHWQAAHKLTARFFIYSLEQLKRYIDWQTDASQPLHLKINTGLNRLGFTLEQLPEALALIKNNRLNLEGVATHFATADREPDDPLFNRQMDVWQQAVTTVNESTTITYVHAANSSTVLKGLGPNVGTMHRPGMAVYGYSPVVSQRDQLKPVLTWKAPVVHTATVKPGETVSYGATWEAKRPSTIAILSVGYYDGLDRKLSNTGHVIINGERCPIVGRVCMDMTMIDTTDCAKPVTIGDEATLIDATTITAYDLAEQIDTIPYEVLARLNPISINRRVVS